jgi:aryl-phospho-beta-D-glucosidase BglC (GH1 family)
MTNWLDSMIKEQDFEEMHQVGINFLRVPVGYWNVLDMPTNPYSAIASESERLGNLSKIMPDSSHYRPYIDKIFKYAAQWDIRVMLDLHGAPGSQNGESNTGCSFKYKGDSKYYWDNELNKEWTIKAVVELAKIC